MLVHLLLLKGFMTNDVLFSFCTNVCRKSPWKLTYKSNLVLQIFLQAWYKTFKISKRCRIDSVTSLTFTWTSISASLFVPPTTSGQYMAHLTELNPNPSMTLVNITMTLTFCCQIISQNKGDVSSLGPCAAMYLNGFKCFWLLSWLKICSLRLMLIRCMITSGFTFGCCMWWLKPWKYFVKFILLPKIWEFVELFLFWGQYCKTILLLQRDR